MPYVKRDSDNKIIELAIQQKPDAVEYLEADNHEIIEFLIDDNVNHQFGDIKDLINADREFIRVLEDLLNLLLDKKIILFTELPEAAQTKLLKRRSLRAMTNVKILSDDEKLI